jgi:hypothetical protein
MRRFLLTLGVACTIVILLVGGLVGVVAYRGSALDKEGNAYVDQAVVDVSKNWDSRELLRRASPEYLSRTSPEQLAALFQNFEKLGHLVHYDGALGQTTMSFFSRDSGLRAHYEANATFENGRARFRIDLSKHDERWMIDGFFVDRPI